MGARTTSRASSPSGAAHGLALLLALAPWAALAQCPTLLVERFIPADCEACWREATPVPAGSLVLDWIVSSPRGDEAPLSAAAIAEAATRVGTAKIDAVRLRRHALAASGPRLTVEDGPAWNGYIGLRLHVRHDGSGRGASGYLALVEAVHPGEDGTPVARQLVRAIAGPLKLDDGEDGTTHLLAMRLPQGVRPERLGAIGWVERVDGEVVAASRTGDASCADEK